MEENEKEKEITIEIDKKDKVFNEDGEEYDIVEIAGETLDSKKDGEDDEDDKESEFELEQIKA